jgi:hypothetical protein
MVLAKAGWPMSRDANKPEPAPTETGGRPIWELVIEDMRRRDAAGRAKYGTALQAHNGRDALVDAYQEALDLAVYLRQAIAERDALAPAPFVWPASKANAHSANCTCGVCCAPSGPDDFPGSDYP